MSDEVKSYRTMEEEMQDKLVHGEQGPQVLEQQQEQPLVVANGAVHTHIQDDEVTLQQLYRTALEKRTEAE